MKKTTRAAVLLGGASLLAVLAAPPASAETTDCATQWSNFGGTNGFVTNYTNSGLAIRDEETASDNSKGPAAVSSADLASGSPSSYPGPYSTTDFGYYNGGTVWDASTPSTMLDDYILFRWRTVDDPAENSGNPVGIANGKYNVLLDLDNDGYKEFWILVDGNKDRVYLYYENLNRQDITDVDNVIDTDGSDNPLITSEQVFSAFSESVTSSDSACSNVSTTNGNPSGTTTSLNRITSHTRTYPVGDGTGDHYLEVQIPMSAFDDRNGNQVMYPDSPVAYVYSTSASNTDPLQKDFMQQLQAGSIDNSKPIDFGDIVTPSGIPTVLFTDSAGNRSDFYLENGNAYIQVIDRLANTSSTTLQSITVTVTNPTTGDDELVTLWETGVNTGVFTNQGGFCAVTPPGTTSSTTFAGWLTGLKGTGTSPYIVSGDVTLTYTGSDTWSVSFTPTSGSATSLGTATANSTFTGGGLSFAVRQNVSPNAPATSPASTLTFCTRASEPLLMTPTATADTQDDTAATTTTPIVADLRASGGNVINVTYVSALGIRVEDDNLIIGSDPSSCGSSAIIGFTRSDGLPSDNFTIASTTTASDRLYVTVVSPVSNTNTGTAQTLSVTLSGNDSMTVTLTETGVNTGVFRNTTGIPMRIMNGIADGDDATTWEDIDGGTITAAITVSSCSYTTTAAIFTSLGGGDVYFTNNVGTTYPTTYTVPDSIYATVRDINLATGTSGCSAIAGNIPPWVAVTGSSNLPPNSIRVTIEARVNGTTTVRDAETITLTQTTSGSGTANSGGSFEWRNTSALSTTLWAANLTSADYGTLSNNGTLNAANDDDIVVVYKDCNDGDSNTANDTKTDTAEFNVPTLVINRILFNATPQDADATSCQTEMIEIYNPSTSNVTLTGWSITDQAGDSVAPDLAFSYTFPQINGADVVMAPGQKAILSFGGPTQNFYYATTNTYYFFDNTASTFPSTYLADNDQLTLYSSTTQTSANAADFVAWAASNTNTFDWIDDDSNAVAAGIWQDNAFALTTGTTVGYSFNRTTNGADRDLPSDFALSGSTDTTCSTLAAATRVTLRGLKADRSGRVQFVTTTQRDTRGFHVWASDARGRAIRRLSAEMSPVVGGINSFAPQRYDLLVDAFSESHILLEELESAGERRFMGPFEVDDPVLAASLEMERTGPVRRSPAPSAGAQRLRGAEAGTAALGTEALSSATALTTVPLRPVVRIEIDTPGVVTLTWSQLEAAGLMPRLKEDPAGLELLNLGQVVPFTASPTGITFTARGLATDYASRNVYLFGKRGRVPRGGVPLTRLGAALRPGFHRVESDVYYTPFVGAGTDPWTWEFAFDGYNPSLAFDLAGLVPTSSTVPVRVHLSGSSPHTHTMEVSLNGTLLGTVQAVGTQSVTLEGEIDGAALRASGNTLEVRYGAEPLDYMASALIDAVDLGVQVDPAGPGAATVVPWTPPVSYGERVRFLIVTPAEFRAAANVLAAKRAAQGHRVQVVTTESLYSRYTHGVMDPAAIKAAIQALGAKLQNVVLLGDDSLDPLNRTGYGVGSRVPSLYAHDGLFGHVPSENLFADRNGDAKPDVAIGRLPANDAAEAQRLVNKAVAQDTLVRAALGHEGFAVDNRTPTDYDFVGAAQRTAAQRPGGRPRTWASLLTQAPADARASLDAALRTGGAVHYFGHAADAFWADEQLLRAVDADQQANSGRGSAVFAWACNAQWYVSIFGPTVNEALLLVENGGAVAAFGPAGVTRPYLQHVFSEKLYARLAQGLTLGEAIRRAKGDVLAVEPGARVIVENFNLLGDPTLRLP